MVRDDSPLADGVERCVQCGKDDLEVRIYKCPICFKRFCEDHTFHRSGLRFCSVGCADYFFHAEPDD